MNPRQLRKLAGHVYDFATCYDQEPYCVFAPAWLAQSLGVTTGDIEDALQYLTVHNRLAHRYTSNGDVHTHC